MGGIRLAISSPLLNKHLLGSVSRASRGQDGGGAGGRQPPLLGDSDCGPESAQESLYRFRYQVLQVGEIKMCLRGCSFKGGFYLMKTLLINLFRCPLLLA